MRRKPPPREAAALEYSPGQAAPKVVAVGKGYVAENIIARAEEHDIPLHEDPSLAHALNMLSIGDEIPSELYAVVAQILIYVREVDDQSAKRLRDSYPQN